MGGAEQMTAQKKHSAFCELIDNTTINNKIFSLDFIWPGPAPKAGQFFMLKPKRSSIFLGRPIGAALWQPASNTVRFLIEQIGRGTMELVTASGWRQSFTNRPSW
jgi:NAD(P)H-flavin reductase